MLVCISQFAFKCATFLHRHLLATRTFKCLSISPASLAFAFVRLADFILLYSAFFSTKAYIFSDTALNFYGCLRMFVW